ncbi:MAG: hypothetical protein PVS2B2_21330 [Candidatus Acidiferrum sp.]
MRYHFEASKDGSETRAASLETSLAAAIRHPLRSSIRLVESVVAEALGAKNEPLKIAENNANEAVIFIRFSK